MGMIKAPQHCEICRGRRRWWFLLFWRRTFQKIDWTQPHWVIWQHTILVLHLGMGNLRNHDQVVPFEQLYIHIKIVFNIYVGYIQLLLIHLDQIIFLKWTFTPSNRWCGSTMWWLCSLACCHQHDGKRIDHPPQLCGVPSCFAPLWITLRGGGVVLTRITPSQHSTPHFLS